MWRVCAKVKDLNGTAEVSFTKVVNHSVTLDSRAQVLDCARLSCRLNRRFINSFLFA